MEDTTIKDELKTYQDLWGAGDYQKSLDWLNQHPESFSAETWHYNLGINLAKVQRLPEARLHLETAYQLGKRDQKTAESLQWIHDKLEAKTWESLDSWGDYVYKFLIYRPQFFFAQLSLGIIAVGLGFYLLKKISLKWLAALLAVAFFSFGIGFVLTQNILIMTLEPTAIYRGPSTIFDSQEIPPGVLLYIRKHGPQYKVLYPSSAAGWIIQKPQSEIKQGSLWDLLTKQK